MSSVRSIASVYWIRSLVPIDRKSSLRMKMPSASAAAGISIMPPILIAAVVRNDPVVEALLRPARSVTSVCSISGALREHRNQHVDLAVMRRAQHRAQLRRNICGSVRHRRIARRPIAGLVPVETAPLICLVRAEVVGADSDRHARPFRADLPVGFELLVLVRQVVAVRETGIRCGTARCRSRRSRAPRDVIAAARCWHAVRPRSRRAWSRACRAARFSFLPLELPLVLAQLVLGEHLRVRIDDDHALRAVDDQQFVFADQLARVVQRRRSTEC